MTTSPQYELTTVGETGQQVLYCGLLKGLDITAENPIPEIRVDFLDDTGAPHILFELNPATGLLVIEKMEELSRRLRWKQRNLLKRRPTAPKGEGSAFRPTIECGQVVNAILAVAQESGRPALILEFNDPKSPIPGAEFEMEVTHALEVLRALKKVSAHFQWQRLYDEAAADVAARAKPH
jgi:hypothetical protein